MLIAKYAFISSSVVGFYNLSIPLGSLDVRCCAYKFVFSETDFSRYVVKNLIKIIRRCSIPR